MGSVSAAYLHGPQQLQNYYQQRFRDMRQLGQALEAGDADSAQQAYASIKTLGQNGPFKNGAPFALSNREQDFEAIGQALQSGDLSAAQQAFASLKQTFQSAGPSPAAETNDQNSSVSSLGYA